MNYETERNPTERTIIIKANYGIKYQNALANTIISRDKKSEIESKAFTSIQMLCLELSNCLFITNSWVTTLRLAVYRRIHLTK